MSSLPVPTCPSGYTLKDLEAFFKIVPGRPHELWDVIHTHEAKCQCATDSDGKGHGIVHPVEAFEPWWRSHKR